MTLAGAVAAISAWSGITGITTNLGDAWNMPPAETLLPALALDFSDGGKAFENVDFTQASGVARVPIAHLLIVSSVGTWTVTKRQATWAYIDSYLAKVRSDLLLSNNLVEPIQIGLVEIGAQAFAGNNYIIVKFNQLWAVAI